MDKENIETMTKPDHPSEHHDLYKYNGLLANQCNRRDKILTELKKRRNDQVDELRRIDEIFKDDENENAEEPMDVVEHRKRRYKHYHSKLMLSEWMSEVPMDLEDKWFFKICPIGVRNVVVANRGITKVFTRRGEKKAIFHSNLPGGSKFSNANTFTLLDCIYRGQERTYYILDVLVWNSHSLLNCSTEFRFFFLKNKLLEDPTLNIESNKFNFVYLNYHEALLPTIEEELGREYSINEIEMPVDGVLFYHKDCPYLTGQTPVVTWLKPYMIPEKLQLPVHESYMAKKPSNYTSLQDYLNYIQTKYKKKKNAETTIDDMDTGITEESSTMDD
ncbi:snurportin1 rnut1 protein rna u transporter 1 [Holotrichia oblita]|uniref:Snurportin1 rnut1 protein rna u transporter 1 n=1 Tax=Holotrichia oblita TaxID=644536 RepID=A0ACB9TY10_HOLOL|nr:snurportin1 rnut1 protein rna u transporter 1 [Holotrichia oblita]